MVDEETAKHRVFFVSAKEAVIIRQQKRKLEVEQKAKTEVGKGLADGWRARFMEFERSLLHHRMFYGYIGGENRLN